MNIVSALLYREVDPYLDERSIRNGIRIVVCSDQRKDMSRWSLTTEVPVGRIVVIGVVPIARILRLPELIRDAMVIAPTQLIRKAGT